MLRAEFVGKHFGKMVWVRRGEYGSLRESELRSAAGCVEDAIACESRLGNVPGRRGYGNFEARRGLRGVYGKVVWRV